MDTNCGTTICADFISFIKTESDRLYKVYKFQECISKEEECFVKIEAETYTCRTFSMNDFRERVENNRFDVEFREFRRKR